MPALASTAEFVDALRKYPFLTGAQQAELLRDLQPRYADPRALARHLLERGWLSSYQVNHILTGAAADLVLGPYVILERVGAGGAGEVYKARHITTAAVAALKMLRKDLLVDPEVVQRFRREVHLAGQLAHVNVVRAIDGATLGLGHVLVMEHVEGTDLYRLVQANGPLPPAQAADYVRQAALGLQHIADKGLVHRDIKPSNLIVTRSVGGQRGGVVKVADLGLARLQEPSDGNPVSYVTSKGTVLMGTVDYMAPEQAQDFRSIDIRADIYSLGCTFFYALTGQPPFPQGTPAHKLLLHQLKEPPPLSRYRKDVPPAVEVVLRRMLAKLPEQRFATPSAVAQALSGQAATAPPPAAVGIAPPGAAAPATVCYVGQPTPVLRQRTLARRWRLWLLLGLGALATGGVMWLAY